MRPCSSKASSRWAWKAIEGLASALTDFETIGSQSFKDWAGNVVQSLIEVLTQIIVVDNAVKALRSVLDDANQQGDAGGGFLSILGQLFGSLFGGGGGGVGVEQGVTGPFHDGGIAGEKPLHKLGGA